MIWVKRFRQLIANNRQHSILEYLDDYLSKFLGACCRTIFTCYKANVIEMFLSCNKKNMIVTLEQHVNCWSYTPTANRHYLRIDIVFLSQCLFTCLLIVCYLFHESDFQVLPNLLRLSAYGTWNEQILAAYRNNLWEISRSIELLSVLF